MGEHAFGGQPALDETDRALRAERRILAMMRAGRNKGQTLADAVAIEYKLAFGALTRGQRAAVDAIARAPDWLIGVQGHAGSGKTTMLRAAAQLPEMPRMHGLAPSSTAVRALARGAGIEARTLQWFLTRFDDLSDPERLARGRETYAGSVLAIDEASMIGTVQMEALLRIAGKLDVARVVLIGDTRQLRAVDAGQPFRVLQRAGMATTVMDEVLRQRDAGLAAAVAHVRDGHPDLALRTLGERVQETERETLGEAAGRIWLALPDAARAETAVLAPTHAMRREIHATIREGLALEGSLHGATLTIERLIGRRLTRADAADIQSYAEGDTVVFHRDAYGCLRDDICTVARIGDNEVELAHPDGMPRRFRPAGNASRYLGVFDTDIIEIRAGDRVRWTRNRTAPRARFGHPQAPDLVNGDTAQVLSIDARRVYFMSEHGERFGLARSDPQLRHLDHAYSSTVHAAQGRTVRSVIAVLGAAGLTDQTMLYVEMSRAADEFMLLTDDREALAEVLVHRPDLEESALEAIGEALTSPPVVEPEVFDTLRADWAAVRTRTETAGDIPYFTDGYTDVMSRAAALSAIEDLPADMRRFSAALLAEHRQHRMRERTVTGLIRRMQSHGRRWPELGWAHPDPATALPPEHRQWRDDADRMLDTARAWLGADSDIARHLEAMTDAGIARLRPREREYAVWDTRTPGLGVRVRPSGGTSFVLLRKTDGRSTRHSLGAVTSIRVDDARRRCHALMAEPDSEPPAKRACKAPLFRDFVEGPWKESHFPRYKPSSRSGMNSVLNSQLLPAFGATPLDRITRNHVLHWFDAYSRTAPGGANFGLRILRQILEFAIARGHIEINPARDVTMNRRTTLTRFLSRDELRRLHRALDRHARTGTRLARQADIIRLLLLTGCRRGEILALRWNEVDGDTIALGDTKTGPRKVYLNAQARRIIERQPRGESAFLFPSVHNPERPHDPHLPLWNRVRTEAGIEDVRLHDLRHTMASYAVMNGVPVPVVSRLLGHSNVRMTLRYAHLADKDIDAAAERVGAAMARAMALE